MENKQKDEKDIGLDDGYICQHCGTYVKMFENHSCYMEHLHNQLESKRKRKKRDNKLSKL